MKQRLLLLLLAVALLFGCAKEVEPETVSTTQPAATTAPTTEATEAPTTEPEVEPARNPLTGEIIDQPMYTRPYAVMFNNVIPALPQCGVGEADWVFEVLVEGGLTRCMGLFTTLPQAGDIGSIRSARPYYVSLAQAYDAIYVHAGGSGDAYTQIAETGIDHIDGVSGPNAAAWFYRHQERLNAGVALEHTMFISTQDVLDYAENQNCTFTRQEPVSYDMTFDEDATPEGVDAKTVRVWFGSGGKSTSFSYDEATGLYSAWQYDRDYIDGNTGETLQFRNILVLQADTELHADGLHEVIDLLGRGQGSFICGGKCVDITWRRYAEEDPFTLSLENGAPFSLGVGKCYVGIVPTGSTLDLEG